MLDINRIRSNPEHVKEALLKRMEHVDFTELLQWDLERRQLIQSTDEKKAKRNKVSGDIPRLKKEGIDISDLLSEMKALSDEIKENDEALREVDAKIHQFLSSLPNIPAEDVVAGGKENNQVLRTWGEKPSFGFSIKNHVDLATDLKLVDYERGAKIGGNGFWVYTGMGSILEWALLNYFVEQHLKDGYQFLLPPHILTYQCGYTAGQFPKFTEDVYKVETGEANENMQFILPTAETALINYHRNEIMKEEDLPKKYFAYTPCYRKEAGSYRSEERGMIRGHQFNKVEMFHYTTPEQSETAFEELVVKAEKLVQGLGLYHRVSKLAAKDCSASMGKTFDIEVWIPSMNDFKEVSSASNAYDYQARRGNIRFKGANGKSKFVHTLNASGLATSRIMPAILEQYQQADGSVVVPEVLRKWVGKEILR